jgi:hypothetical protein
MLSPQASCCSLLDVPIVVSEQNPRALGKTVKEITLPNNATVIDKMVRFCEFYLFVHLLFGGNYICHL